jgi:pyruvate dehydrogenase E1 component beta subunit
VACRDGGQREFDGEGRNQVTERTWLQAAALGLREEMARDPKIFVMGEDVRAGVFGLTTGLIDQFGPERVRDTPISEETIVGAGVGAAMCGLRPFVDLNIATFAYTAFDQIVNQVAKNRFLFGGQAKLPLVIFLNELHRSYAAAQHTDRPHGLFMAIPGLKIVAPGTPGDAKGLIKAAIRSDDPVMVFSDMTSWKIKGDVPDDPEFLVPIGPIRIARRGSDVTLVSVVSLQTALTAAERLEADHGVHAEVLDLRTLAPLDEEGIVRSVAKTGRLVVVDVAHQTAGAAAEVAAVAAEHCFDMLRAPVLRVCTPDIHIPYSPPLERTFFPTPDSVIRAVLQTMQPTGRSAAQSSVGSG